MKSLQRILLILSILSSICAVTTGAISDFESCQTASNNIFYRKSTVDLIVSFFKTYKHIKRITLFMCDNTSDSTRIPFDYHRNAISSANVEQNRCLNFQQIVKYLMASGNFLIKADGNVDARPFSTVGDACDKDMNPDNAYRVWDMLKSGDFKQGVVIDTRCRQSRFILQQVSWVAIHIKHAFNWLIFVEKITRNFIDSVLMHHTDTWSYLGI